MNENINFLEDIEDSFAPKPKKNNKRILTKPKGNISKNARSALVIAAVGNTYFVQDNDSAQLVECSKAGALITNNPNSSIVAVGDAVCYELDENRNSIDYKGIITKIEERRNCFSRTTVGNEGMEQVIAANVDKVVIVVSAANPTYNLRLIDRLLVNAELNSIEPVICINKMDLLAADEISDIKSELEIYSKLGIPLFFISALNNKGITELLAYVSNSNSVFIGSSGVGKSTLLNSVFGSELQSVQEISESTNKGRHTTSAVRMFRLKEGGSIIDTPGVREFALWGIEKNELRLYFHEFDEFSGLCKYPSCTHIHEPDCAVIDALEQGKLSLERYESYINIFESIKD